jgi:FAD/FMN-containing dehydrogenase
MAYSIVTDRRPRQSPTPASIPEALVTVADPGWNEARRAWNLAIDQRPAAITTPRSVEEVIRVIDFARERGLRVAPQATGHGASALGPLEDTVLLKTSGMRGVEIDAADRVARVQAGAQWLDVTEPAAKYGLAALAGSAPDVGVVGYTLGGGLSWLARRYGLAAGSLLAVELVTADGRLLRADHDHEPELFWALRGGGGNFGIVTAMEFALYPVQQVYAGAMFWPMERASEVITAWRELTVNLPDEVTSLARLVRVPPLPDVPVGLRGRALVAVEACYLGERRGGESLFAPLRRLGPEIDTFAMIPASALGAVHMDPDQPVPAFGDGMLLSDLPASAVEGLVATAGAGANSPLLSVELRHLGGALETDRWGSGTVSLREAQFAMFAVGITPDAAAVQITSNHVDVLQRVLARWDTGRMYLNFAERPRLGDSLFGKQTHRRLRELKARHDPEDLIRANHPVTPAAA